MNRGDFSSCGQGFSLARSRVGLKPDPQPRDCRKPARGFSLIEVLVAFVILALVATALFGLFSTSLNNASAAEEWSRAVLFAESRLDAAAAAQPLNEGAERGSEEGGRITWETRVTAYTAPDVDPDLERASEALAMRLYRVTVDLRYTGGDGKERTLSLATLKLGRKP